VTTSGLAAEQAPVPTGELVQLRASQLRVNPNNPRKLFDPGPLSDLKANIRTHGVLVPLTAYRLPGQNLYEIQDGQRRYQCSKELEAEGHQVLIPANIVSPPTKIAGLLYMFNSHNYRQQWELMPTALSLRIIMRDLGTQDTKRLANLTGLSDKNVERCKILLSFPEKYQLMSLDPNPRQRIPSNFWIESHPVLSIVRSELPDLMPNGRIDPVVDSLVTKYQAGNVRSVIHFRAIVEAYEVAEAERQAVLRTLRRYLTDPRLETRAAFDGFLAENRRVQTALRACATFLNALEQSQLENVVEDRLELIDALISVRVRVEDLVGELEGTDAPAEPDIDEAS
jgi:ParB/RepB/Spo0J family partition protein